MFALRLKELRMNKRLSQRELASLFKVSTGTVGNWEVGTREPDYATLTKLANFFGVSVDYLLGREDITPEERAAGASGTKTVKITPLEDELLYVFREVGAKRGEAAQRALIELMEKMI